MVSFVKRMIGAAMLNVATYEEVKADPKATVQAVCVVLLSVVATGIGGIGIGGQGLILALAYFLVGWVAWVFLTWMIGTKFLPEAETKADVGQLIRAIGFAASPGILSALGWIPIVGTVFKSIAWYWTLAASVVAMRQVFNYKSTARAIIVCVIGWVVIFILYVIYVGLMWVLVPGDSPYGGKR